MLPKYLLTIQNTSVKDLDIGDFMIKVLIWRVSNDISFQDKAIKILEQQHDGVEIVGNSTTEEIAKVYVGEYDILLVVGAKKIRMGKVAQNIKSLNLPDEKIFRDWIVCIPGFTLEKYRQLQNSHLSIIAKHCFGSLIYHLMGLPFLTPFIDMGIRNDNECITLFRNLRSYIMQPLVLQSNISYPIYKLVDVNIHMSHYSDFEAALVKWNERKQRINFDNLFIEMFTENKEIAEQFDALPYDKKVCFVPFKSDFNSAWYINPQLDINLKLNKKRPFWEIVNRFADNYFFYYDPFDMLLYGKKTPLIDM